MRLFIAIDIPPGAADYIKNIQNLLKKKRFFTGTYVEQKNLHITVVFLGTRTEAELAYVIQKVSALDFSSFLVRAVSVALDSISSPHVLWVTMVSPDLELLAQNVRQALVDLKLENQDTFIPHATIARIKKAYFLEGLLELVQGLPQPLFSFDVFEIKVKSSILTPHGPVYATLYTHNLKTAH